MAGIVERLATGEKREFQSSRELLQYLRGWINSAVADRGSTQERYGHD